MWRDRAQSRLALEMVGGVVQPSRQYLRWYYHWARLYLIGHRDPAMPAAGMIPPFLPDWLPDTPEMVQPDDDALPAEKPMNAGRRRRAAGRGRGRGAGRGGGNPARAQDNMLGAPPSLDTLAGPSHHESPMLQTHIGGIYEQPHSSHVFHPQASTPDIDFTPENYTQWVADMIGQSSYQLPPSMAETSKKLSETSEHRHLHGIPRSLAVPTYLNKRFLSSLIQ
ncbi:hypothetical protein PIB30_021087 [Stylosanthes scabra]|uniref:Uncharacterized protein n=1 Tax=Stylosanthes scabra TaxID=79078 RepID=A0ABU6Y7B5_9FABA|nr:hypothetical protein [Stylosanthes scabra]